MTRCQSCDGILTKHEKACIQCGEPAPDKPEASQSFFLLLVVAGLIVTLGFAAYSFLSGRQF
jgi:hypothetical protein